MRSWLFSTRRAVDLRRVASALCRRPVTA
ncbi:putative leader peptide [Cellulomonas sp. NPDC089187]